jgi:hypothetical protein
VIPSVGWVSQQKLGDLTLLHASAPATRSDLSPSPPHHPPPTARPSAPARLCPVKSARQQSRSNCSPVWLAPPHRRLLCSRCLTELLHATAILSPRSGQADAPPPLCPIHPPRPGLCHLSLRHALAPSCRHLTTGHHRRRLCSACRPPNLGRWLWTSPARPPPLAATSRLLRTPSADRLGPLSGIAPPTAANECSSKV